MPIHRGLWYTQWQKCDRCTFTYPIGQLTNQKGMLLCPKCVDNLDVEFRPQMISDILADTIETENEREHIGDDPQTIEF